MIKAPQPCQAASTPFMEQNDPEATVLHSSSVTLKPNQAASSFHQFKQPKVSDASFAPLVKLEASALDKQFSKLNEYKKEIEAHLKEAMSSQISAPPDQKKLDEINLAFPQLLAVSDHVIQENLVAYIIMMETAFQEVNVLFQPYSLTPLNWKRDGVPFVNDLMTLISQQQSITEHIKGLSEILYSQLDQSAFEVSSLVNEEAIDSEGQLSRNLANYLEVLLPCDNTFSLDEQTYTTQCLHYLSNHAIKFKMLPIALLPKNEGCLFYLNPICLALSGVFSCEQVLGLTQDTLQSMALSKHNRFINRAINLGIGFSLVKEVSALIWTMYALPSILGISTELKLPYSDLDVLRILFNAQFKALFFQFHTQANAEVSLTPPPIDTIRFGEEVEYILGSTMDTVGKGKQKVKKEVKVLGDELEKTIIASNLPHERINSELNETSSFKIGNWSIKVFTDSPCLECHCTPYQFEQTFAVNSTEQHKQSSTYDLLDKTIFSLANDHQLVPESGHKHIDIYNVMSGNPELCLRFITLFLKANYLTVVLNRQDREEYFQYPKGQVREKFLALGYTINKLRAEGYRPKQGEFGTLVPMIDMLKIYGLINTKNSAVNLNHINHAKPYSKSIDTVPNTTLELRVFHCPASGKEVMIINKFCIGLIKLAWQELLDNEPITLNDMTVKDFTKEPQLAELFMAQLCKKIGLSFEEFCILMKIPITKACTGANGYSSKEYIDYKASQKTKQSNLGLSQQHFV
ncbi:hypothetical protein SOPP22_06060 [Shewanella sp. OPT22]|nr:hypothetical protein SOPP22_06060 [Shewanella sp. OPT22]